jgi:hypothetical protein
MNSLWFEAGQQIQFHHIEMGHENGYDSGYSYFSEYWLSCHEVFRLVNSVIGTMKFILTVIRSANCFHRFSLVTISFGWESGDVISYVIMPFIQMLFPETKLEYTSRLNIALDKHVVLCSRWSNDCLSRLSSCILHAHCLVLISEPRNSS